MNSKFFDKIMRLIDRISYKLSMVRSRILLEEKVVVGSIVRIVHRPVVVSEVYKKIEYKLGLITHINRDSGTYLYRLIDVDDDKYPILSLKNKSNINTVFEIDKVYAVYTKANDEFLFRDFNKIIKIYRDFIYEGLEIWFEKYVTSFSGGMGLTAFFKDRNMKPCHDNMIEFYLSTFIPTNSLLSGMYGNVVENFISDRISFNGPQPYLRKKEE